MKYIKLTVNGEVKGLEVSLTESLLELLRDRLRLTGTKEGCNVGECGACTVIFNGKPVNACLVLAAEADGSEVLTVEGLAHEGELHSLQQSFLDSGAVQCGFCTPGMLMSGYALLSNNQNPTEAEIRKGISGNLCRCTGYKKIVEAIKLESTKMQKGL